MNISFVLFIEQNVVVAFLCKPVCDMIFSRVLVSIYRDFFYVCLGKLFELFAFYSHSHII